jgi:hypothetical protein
VRKETEVSTSTETLSICDGCRLIPVSHLSLDIAEPMGGFPRMLAANGIGIVEDDVGRPSITRETLGELLAERREREERLAEEARQRQAEEVPKKVRPAGVAGREGMSAVEAMISQDPAFSTPAQDFRRVPGGTTAELLDAQLAEGQRRQAERRAETAEKQRIAALREKAKKAKRTADEALKKERAGKEKE